MVREVAITNYGCLRDVKVRLGPLTVLVGPNASGKSTFLRALQEDARLHPDRAWQQRGDLAIEIRVSGEDDWVRRREPGKRPEYGGFPVNCQVLRLDRDKLRAPDTVQQAGQLGPYGSQLTNLLITLGRRRFIEISERLCHLVPVFGDVDIRPAAGKGMMGLFFQDRWNPDSWYPAHQVSDGTLLMLAFLTIPYQDPAPDILAIEDPERGLHPYLMEQVVGTLRQLSLGELGPRAVQVILATHSAELLEYLDPEEIRFFDRSREDGSTDVREAPTDTETWKAAFEEYERSLGSAWLSGGLGGIPGQGG